MKYNLDENKRVQNNVKRGENMASNGLSVPRTNKNDQQYIVIAKSDTFFPRSLFRAQTLNFRNQCAICSVLMSGKKVLLALPPFVLTFNYAQTVAKNGRASNKETHIATCYNGKDADVSTTQ